MPIALVDGVEGRVEAKAVRIERSLRLPTASCKQQQEEPDDDDGQA